MTKVEKYVFGVLVAILLAVGLWYTTAITVVVSGVGFIAYAVWQLHQFRKSLDRQKKREFLQRVFAFNIRTKYFLPFFYR